MNTTRRIAVLVGAFVAVIIGTSIPASATYSDSVARTTSITTATVQAPTQVEVKGYCTSSVDPVTGVVTTTVHAKVEWWRSSTRGVSGYRVTAHLNNGSSYVMATTDASADESFGSADAGYLAYQPRFTVMTLTSYGWTAQSVPSNVLTC